MRNRPGCAGNSGGVAEYVCGMSRNMSPLNFRRLPVLAAGTLLLAAAGCSSSFFAVTPEGGVAPTRTTKPPAAETPAAKPVQQPAAKPAEKPATPAPRSPIRPAATPAPPGPVPAAPPAFDPEPAPTASDSAGIARLQRLSLVWHVASLYHPAVIDRGAPWDSAFIVASTRVRAATDAGQLERAYTQLLSVLGDPLSRIERTGLSGNAETGRAGAGIALDFAVRVTRTADSVMVLSVPVAHNALPVRDRLALQEALRSAPSRVLIDLRADMAATPGGSVTATTAEAVSDYAQALVTAPLVHTAERIRRVGGAREVNGVVVPGDAWLVRGAGPMVMSARDGAPRRIAVVANAASVIPGDLLALIADGRATLVAEESLSEQGMVSSLLLPIAPGTAVRLRTGELLQANGRTGVYADTTLPRPASPGDSAPAMRAAMAMLRGARAPRTERPQVVRAPATLPTYYDTDPYPFMGARLLAGARVWSAMRVRHAHRDLYDDDIDARFAQSLPVLETARSSLEYAKALQPLIGAFDDAQVTMRGASADSARGGASAPFRVRWIENRAIITDIVRDSTTAAFALENGMEITAADGFPLPAWIFEHRDLVPASNDWTRMSLLMPELTRGTTGGALFRVRDAANRERQLNIPRTSAYRNALPTGERTAERRAYLTPNGYAYIDVTRLSADSAAVIIARSRGARAWILDLRGDAQEWGPRTQPPLQLVQAVRARPVAVMAREVTRFGIACPAATLREQREQCADERTQQSRTLTGDTAGHYPGRIVALIDERTRGDMEQLALALEAVAPVTFIGSPSAGSPASVTGIALPGALTLELPLAELRLADGRQLQRVGITPQVEVRLTVRGVRNGVDDVIQRADRWLQQQLEPTQRSR